MAWQRIWVPGWFSCWLPVETATKRVVMFKNHQKRQRWGVSHIGIGRKKWLLLCGVPLNTKQKGSTIGGTPRKPLSLSLRGCIWVCMPMAPPNSPRTKHPLQDISDPFCLCLVMDMCSTRPPSNEWLFTSVPQQPHQLVGRGVPHFHVCHGQTPCKSHRHVAFTRNTCIPQSIDTCP